MDLLEMDLLETKALTQMPNQENSALHTMMTVMHASAKKAKDVYTIMTNRYAHGLIQMLVWEVHHLNEDEKKAYLQANYK